MMLNKNKYRNSEKFPEKKNNKQYLEHKAWHNATPDHNVIGNKNALLPVILYWHSFTVSYRKSRPFGKYSFYSANELFSTYQLFE